MFKKSSLLILITLVTVLAACSTNVETEDEADSDEIKALEVDFTVPETSDVQESVELHAVVTYGGELVTDADQLDFEYWVQGDEENSTTIEATNNGDGTYTSEVTFDEEAIYEMYAHTTAHGIHTMPKKSIQVGDAEVEESHADEEEAHEHTHTDGFGMHFVKPESVQVGEETNLMVHLTMDDEPFTDADVRFEIWNDDISDKHEWLDAEESSDGEYTSDFTFEEPGVYTMQIHVRDDND